MLIYVTSRHTADIRFHMAAIALHTVCAMPSNIMYFRLHLNESASVRFSNENVIYYYVLT